MDASAETSEGPVQDSWPDLTCYGCGPANEAGLRLKSYVGDDGETLVATVVPDEVFNSGAPNVMYGGHIASLVDCHSIWTAITFAYAAEERPLGSEPRIAYVTADLHVHYHAPTPMDREIRLVARIDGEVGRRTTVRTELGPADGSEPTVTAEVLAVRVDPPDVAGHHQAERHVHRRADDRNPEP